MRRMPGPQRDTDGQGTWYPFWTLNARARPARVSLLSGLDHLAHRSEQRGSYAFTEPEDTAPTGAVLRC